MSLQQKRERTLLWLVLGILAAAVVNLSVFSFRADLTSAGAWSISAATKAVMAQAKEPVTLTYFLSKKLTTYYPFTQGIADFLEEYAAASRGKVSVRVVDPQDSGQLAEMPRLGLQSIPIQVVEQSQQTQAVVYSGIVLQYLDRQEVLPAVSQIETLEYDLTVKLNKIVTQKQKTIAFLSTDPTKTLQNDFSLLSQTLSKNAVFREVPAGQPVGDASVLIVAGAKGITPTVLKSVDEYLMKGGKVLFAVDGVFIDIASPQATAVPAGDNALLKALEGWGVKVEPTLANDAFNNVVQFQGSQGVTLRRYSLWPQLLAKNASATHPVTSRFAGFSLLWPSPLTVVTHPGLSAEVLASTSEKAWEMKENLTIDVDQAARSAQAPGTRFGKLAEIVAVKGTFTSAFPGGGTSPDTRILVLGSSNSLTNLMQITQRDDNAVFVADAADWLAQDEALLSIKTRAYRDKSLTLLQDAGVREAAAFSLSFFNLFLIPAAVLVWAVVRLLRRRSKETKHD